MANDIDINIRFHTNQAKKSAKALNAQISVLNKTAIRAGDLFKAQLGLSAVHSALTLLRGATIGTIADFKDFEAALIRVSKTTDINGEELDQLGDSFKELSREIPIATLELLRIADVAGQLGIKGSQNILTFTETVGKLTIATDLTGQQAASSLAKILELADEPVSNIEELGNVIVRLGNNMNTTESQIVAVSNEVSRSTVQFGLTSAEVVALSASLKALGARAEGSGTAIGKVFRRMSAAISEGGSELKRFAKISGVSVNEFKNNFEEDAFRSFVAFLKGLRDNTSDMNAELKAVGLSTDRLNKVIPVLADRYDTLAGAIVLASDEQSKLTALNIEADKVSQGLEGRLTKLSNAWFDLSSTVGEEFSPAIKATVTSISNLLSQMKDLTVEVGISQLAFEHLNPIVGVINRLERELARVPVPLKEINNRMSFLQKSISDTELSIESFVATEETISRGTEKIRLQKEELEKLNKEALKYAETITDIPVVNLDDIIKRAPATIREARKDIALLKKEAESLKVTLSFKAFENVETDALRRKLDIVESTINARESAINALRLRREMEFQNKRTSLTDLFEKAENAKLEEQFLSEVERKQLNEDTVFGIIEAGLGKVEALKTAARAKDLIAEGKQTEALALVLETRKKSEEKQEKTKLKLTAKFAQANQSIASSSATIIGTLGAEGARAAFVIQKGVAIAQAITAAQVAIVKAQALDPTGALALRTKIATGFNIAAIIATSPKGFEDGGIVGGNSFSGDNVSARVNSGEMILNRQQQSNLFKIAQSGGSTENQGQKDNITHVTMELDGEVVGRAVSRQVADGLELGEVV